MERVNKADEINSILFSRLIEYGVELPFDKQKNGPEAKKFRPISDCVHSMRRLTQV